MRAEKARRRLAEFCRQAWPVLNPGRPLVWGWYLDAICEHLEAVTRGQIVKLLVIQPPNTLKSTVVSVLWPAWEWATDPAVRWLFAANELGLATRDAGFCRELVLSPWFRERWGAGWRMRPDSDEKTWYSTSKGGHRISLSTNARVTGKKGDRLVVDDPHDARKVQSETDRAAVRDWFGSAFLSRRADERTTPVVVAGQRVARDDLIGELKAQGDWVVLRLTEEFDPPRRCVTPIWADPRTEPGEWLRPERFGPAEREKRVREATFAVYACQHNDDPRHFGGKFFDRLKARLVPAAPQGTVAVRYWDTAATKGVASANTAGVLLGRTPAGRFVVLDCAAANCSPAERKALMRQVAAADRRRPGVSVLSTWIEQPGGFGTESVQSDILDLAGFWVQPNKVGSSSGSKEERWKPLSAQWEAGNVDVVDADWTEAFLAEMDAVPNGPRKDRCIPAGVPVLTGRGWVPIEQVNTSDLAVTRKGLRPVIWSGQTAAAASTTFIECDDGGVLECTPNHPVYVVGKGFVPAEDVTAGDEVLRCDQNPWSKPSNGAGCCGGVTRNRRAVTCGSTSPASGPDAANSSTGPSGSTLTVRSRPSTTFTTRTATRSTTTSATSNASPRANTASVKNCSAPPTLNVSVSTSTPSAARRPNGTGQRRGETGTENTPRKPLPCDGRCLSNAEGVGLGSRPRTSPRCTADRSAATHTAAHGPQSIQQPASDAGWSSWPSNAANGFAATAVASVRPGRQGVPVFNLTVADDPEYFAAGFLVHNCDAAAGAFLKLTLGGGGAEPATGDPATESVQGEYADAYT